MVTVQQQQAEAFGGIAAAIEQEKYDALFAAVPKFDGKTKNLPPGSTGSCCFNRKKSANGVTEQVRTNVMTMLSAMNEEIDDENLKQRFYNVGGEAPRYDSS